VRLDLKASPATTVYLAAQDQKDKRALPAGQDRRDLQAPPVPEEHRDIRDHPAQRGRPEPLDRMDRLGSLVFPDLRVSAAPRASREYLERQDRPASLDRPGPWDCLVTRETQVSKGRRHSLVHQVRLATQERLGRQVILAPLVKLVLQVELGRQEPQVPQAGLDRAAYQDFPVPPVALELQALPGQPEPLASRDRSGRLGTLA